MHITEVGRDSPQQYNAYFHYEPTLDCHEAFVARNAIVARTISDIQVSMPAFGNDADKQFEMMSEAIKVPDEAEVPEMVSRLNSNIEETREEGTLKSYVHVVSTAAQLKYLGESLRVYQLATASFAVNTTTTFPSSQTEQAAFIRVLESTQLIPGMVKCLTRVLKIDFDTSTPPNKIGFSQAV